MNAQAYRGLKVWQRGMELVTATYRVTENLPRTGMFGLQAQARRAAVSVPANIAEGYGRSHRGDYLRHLSIARGSLMELETLLLLLVQLEYLKENGLTPAWSLAQQTGSMLTVLIRKLKTQEPTPDPTTL